jgi:hypothetical protein
MIRIIMPLIFCMIISCGPSKEEVDIKKAKEKNTLVEKYNIVVIEGCEYIEFNPKSSSHVLTHKGNCNNPIHVYVTNN